MKATVITDASFCLKTRYAGWAVWIVLDGGERIKKYGAFKSKPQGSNEAEWWAALNGVFLACKHGATEILLQSDNTYVIDRINKKPSYHNKFLEKRDINDVLIMARHVKGHTQRQDARSYVNRWCDHNARTAMRQKRAEKLNGHGK